MVEPAFPRVSVVVPVRNEEASIDACLASLAGQDVVASDVEILVVDGASTDRTPQLVAAWTARDPRILLLSNPAGVSPVGLNIGIRAARGSVIARMSGHSVAAADYLSRGIRDLELTGAWCVGGQSRRIVRTQIGKAIAAATTSPLGVGNAVHNYGTSAQWAETAFPGMWPREVLERVGLFDEELVRNQDDEHSYRIREAGGGIWYDPEIVVAYEPRQTLRRLSSQYRQYAMWKVRVLQMHPRALRWRHWVPMAWVGCLAVCAVFGLLYSALWGFGVCAVLAWFAAVGAGSLRLSRRVDVPAAQLLAAFLVLHLSYGIGFWQGLVRFAPRWLVRRAGRPPRFSPAATTGEVPA